MRKIIAAMVSILVVFAVQASDRLEIPIYAGARVEVNRTMASNQPGVKNRLLIYKVEAAPDSVLQFYKKNPYISRCSKNKSDRVYRCQLKRHGSIRSGDLFIDMDKHRGKVEVTFDYLYN